MRVSTAIRVVVVCLLAVGVARATDFDKSYPIKGNLVEMNLDVGNGVTLARIEIRNTPTIEDIQKGGNEKCRVKPSLYLVNKSNADIRIFTTVTLEDGQGNVFLKCSKSTKVDAGENDDSQNLCWMEYMLCKDWPTTKVLHLAGNVSTQK